MHSYFAHYIALLLVFVKLVTLQTLASPCPNLFVYEPITEPDRWYGVVTLRSDTELSGVWLRIILDRPALQLGNWFGEALTTDNQIFRIRKPTHKLPANVSEPLRFYIKYDPSGQIPRVVEFQLNAKTICPESGVSTAPPITTPELSTSPELSTTVGSTFYSEISTTGLPITTTSPTTTTSTTTTVRPRSTTITSDRFAGIEENGIDDVDDTISTADVDGLNENGSGFFTPRPEEEFFVRYDDQQWGLWWWTGTARGIVWSFGPRHV